MNAAISFSGSHRIEFYESYESAVKKGKFGGTFRGTFRYFIEFRGTLIFQLKTKMAFRGTKKGVHEPL